MPVIAALPVVAVENGIQADALHWNSSLQGLIHFAADLPDPSRASGAEVTCLRHEERPAIALPYPAEHSMQRRPARIARLVFPSQALLRELPLVRVIVIHSEDIEITLISAQLRPRSPGDHVPRLVL